MLSIAGVVPVTSMEATISGDWSCVPIDVVDGTRAPRAIIVETMVAKSSVAGTWNRPP